jgi:RNA polymerase sigma-B factor
MSDESLWPLRHQPRAREEIVRRYLPLAQRLASRYRNPHEPQEDLEQVAGLALLGAVHRFDPERGLPFAAFAVPTILGELKKHFRDTGWALHVPRAAAERAQRVQRAGEQLSERLGRSPTVAELAEHLELELELVVEALEAASARWAVSLNVPVGADQGDAVDLVEILGDTDGGYELVDARLALADGLRALPFQERWAVRLRAEEELTQAEIGLRLGCSQMQVSRLLGRASERLRSHLEGVVREPAPAGARSA